jgi:hypothetical protein
MIDALQSTTVAGSDHGTMFHSPRTEATSHRVISANMTPVSFCDMTPGFKNIYSKQIFYHSGPFSIKTHDLNEPFEKLAELHPERFVAILSNLRPGILTNAAEIAGRLINWKIIGSTLLKLLNDTQPIVREGALHGLKYHSDEPEVMEALKKYCDIELDTELIAIAHEMFPHIKNH